jgi:hypothetical protein
MQKFANITRMTVQAHEPSTALLDVIRGKLGRVCPLDCSPRQYEKDGLCVTKTCPSGFDLDQDGNCERHKERSRGAARATEPGPSSRAAPAVGRVARTNPTEPIPRNQDGQKDWNQIAINCKAQAISAHGQAPRNSRSQLRGMGLTTTGQEVYRRCYASHKAR